MSNKNKIKNPDLAVCFDDAGNLHIATSNEHEILYSLIKVEKDTNLFEEVLRWRASYNLYFDENTVIRFVSDLFTEQTKVLSVSEEHADLGSDEILDWFVASAQNKENDLFGKPIFEADFEEVCFDYNILRSKEISLTEIPRKILEVTKDNYSEVAIPSEIKNELDGDNSDYFHAVETQLRAVTRYAVEEESDYLEAYSAESVHAFFIFSRRGCGFALWNIERGYFLEIGELFEVEESEIPDGVDAATYIGQTYGDRAYSFLNEQFYQSVVDLEPLYGEKAVERIVWVAETGMYDPLSQLINSFSEDTEIGNHYFDEALEKMIVLGLVEGVFEETTEYVPAINLANDIRLQYEKVQSDRETLDKRNLAIKKRRAIGYLLLPVICALGLVFGLLFNNFRVAKSLSARTESAKVEKNRLAPLLKSRTDYEVTLTWYKTILEQIVNLRDKQTSTISFSSHLDKLFPATSSFFISDLTILPGGDFELKGMSRVENSVSDFVRSMEFYSNVDGKRYFENLAVSFKQGSDISIANSKSGSGVDGSLADGVSGFVIKGKFLPASILKSQSSNSVKNPIKAENVDSGTSKDPVIENPNKGNK